MIGSSRFSRFVVSTIAITATFVGSVVAQDRDPRLHGNFVMVFDSSGSMNAVTADEDHATPKISVARSFGRSLFGQERDRPDIEGGLIIFGSNYDSDQPGSRTPGCRDVSIKVGLRKMDAATVETAVAALAATHARGYTPLRSAVEKAIDVLGPAGGSILLVTDLEDTCDGETTEQACRLLTRTNAERLPANRVYFDSIVVTRSKAMDTRAIEQLSDCAHAPVVTLTNEKQANEAANVVATRLAGLARQGDRPLAPGQTSTPPPMALRLTVLGDPGGVGGRPNMSILLRNRAAGFERSLPLAVGTTDLQMAPGIYDVSTVDGRGGERTEGTVEVRGETVELVLSIPAP